MTGQPIRSLLTLAVLFASLSSTLATTFLVEAEKLEVPGAWEPTEFSKNEAVRHFLTAGAHARNAPIVGAIDLPHAGKWRLWVRSKDFAKDRPGTRTFTVRLGTETAEPLFGKHGQEALDGWAWEDGGVLELPAGSTLVSIGDTAAHSARCDALVVSDNLTYVPAGPPWLLYKEAAKMVPLTYTGAEDPSYLPKPVQEIGKEPVAKIENATVRLTFHTAKTKDGPAIAMAAFTRDRERWLPIAGEAGADSYRVISRPADSDPKISSAVVFPRWDIRFAPEVDVSSGGASAKTRLGLMTAPWASGNAVALRPTGAEQIDESTVKLTFPETIAGSLTAIWKIDANRPDAMVKLTFAPKAPGYFSLGYHGPLVCQPAETDFMLLPFEYQGRRFPDEPKMLLSAQTPTPMTLINRGGVSCALVGDPSEIPFEWADKKNSRYALSLRNESAQAQSLLYSPVLGMPGSISDGAPIEAKFHLWLQRGDWYAAYRSIADGLFHVRDYRRPTTASLSDAIWNLYDFLGNEPAAGWSAKAKGPWNIESRSTVTQSSPLTYLSLYLLTGDEKFYRERALPSLEYVLSRPSAHFAAEQEISDNYYTHRPMVGPSPFHGANTFASAYAMTQGRTDVFGQYCIDEKGAPRRSRVNSHYQPWEDALALFRLTGEQRWLDEAMAGADQYIAGNLSNLPTRDLNEMPFVNVSFIPDWEGLLHVYQASGEKRFLDAAKEGARWLMATFWTQPLVPDGKVTINPGGVYEANRHVWWFGDRLFRLGMVDEPASGKKLDPPAAKLPEKQIPVWWGSNVGLGLEQPSTYTRNGAHANIMMNTWAPGLLRLARPTGDPAFRTAARNATIGRFANYPGYYLDGMNDLYLQPDYPVKGPDVTALYVHHAPPFAAYAVDYLFTDAEERSKGAVAFPWVRSCGYVWFDNRLYGHAPGEVYGQSAWPWLHRTAATVDTINVDHLLAEGGGKFFTVLLNQITEVQHVKVTFDPKVLGRGLEGAKVQVMLDNQPADGLVIANQSVELDLPPLAIASLAIDGVKIDVPTHRVVPPGHFTLPAKAAEQRLPLADTGLEAVGNMLNVPPFEWRDLYIYITADINACKAARLRYRVGQAAEQTLEDADFPWEFSAKITDLKAPVTWQVDVQMADGRWVKADSKTPLAPPLK